MPARPLIAFFILLVIVICALIYNKVKNRVDETFDNDGVIYGTMTMENIFCSLLFSKE